MKIVGIDPGINGGLSIVEISDAAAPVLIDCIDIPVVGTGAKERVDVAAIHNFIDRHKPVRALIERAQAMPKQGASSGFKYGRAVGAIEATIALCSIPVESPVPGSAIGICRARTRRADAKKHCSSFLMLMQRSRASAITVAQRHR
jgi:Holliday junction resolvasome RuvABC endonuclease subunit